MPNLHIVTDPPMTKKLVAAGAFAETPMIVVDIGARGGIEWYWRVFGDHVRIIAFEPDPEECRRLNERAGKNVTFIAAALGSTSGPRTLYVMRHADSTSFYAGVPEWNRRYVFADNAGIEREITVQTTTLRDALQGQEPDFIKLDAEGAEFDILCGADLAPVLGLVAELNLGQAPTGQPSFADFDPYCRAAGLQLYDIDVYRFSRKALPYPFLYDLRDGTGRPVPGATTQGQALSSDALYFRDGLATDRPVKLACLFEIFGLNDCAAEVILAHRAAFAAWADPADLLELLVPAVKGRKLSYADYVARHATDPLFRPTPGWRQPPQSVSTYDGVFIPAWMGLRQRLYWLWRTLFRRL